MSYGTWVVDAEGIEGRGEGHWVRASEGRDGIGEGHGADRGGLCVGASGYGEEGYVIWQLLVMPFLSLVFLVLGAVIVRKFRGQRDKYTRNKSVHSVNRNEFFGEGIRDVIVVDSGSRDATDNLTRLRDAAERLSYLFAYKTPPVGVESNLDCRMMQNGWRPFYGMDLCHQSDVDKASSVKQLITIPPMISHCSNN